MRRGKHGLATEQMYQDDDRATRENRFSDCIGEAFRIAEIQYGRADFGLVNGRPQVYEINTNPNLGILAPHHSSTRMASLAFARQRLAQFLEAIYVPDGGELIEVDIPLRARSKLEETNDAMMHKNDAMMHKLEKFEAECVALRTKQARLERKLQSILSSRFWRYTAPVRKILQGWRGPAT